LILRGVRQRPFVVKHLAEITAINPSAAGRTFEEMLGLAGWAFAKPLSEILAARDHHGISIGGVRFS
jgi:hypothetical protein